MKRPMSDDERLLLEARAAMRDAALRIEGARIVLRALLARLKAHPDFAKTQRRPRGAAIGPHLTLAFWLHNCVHSALHDAPIDEAHTWLLDDAYHAPRTMRLFADTEARDIRRLKHAA